MKPSKGNVEDNIIHRQDDGEIKEAKTVSAFPRRLIFLDIGFTTRGEELCDWICQIFAALVKVSKTLAVFGGLF